MTPRGPLSDRMHQAMRALGRLEAQPRPGRKTTPAVIASEVERAEGRFELLAAGGRHGRGRDHRVMNQAQRFITPLRALERRRLVARVRGGEFILTDLGEEWIEEDRGAVTDAAVLQAVRDLIDREGAPPTRHEVARELDASVEHVEAQLVELAKRRVLRIRRRPTPDYIHRIWEPRDPGPTT